MSPLAIVGTAIFALCVLALVSLAFVIAWDLRAEEQDRDRGDA